MTRPLVYILTCILLSLELQAQTKDTSTVSTHEIKSFLASIKQQELKNGLIYLSDRPYVLEGKDITYYATSADIFLSKQDDEFIKNQFEQTKTLVWDKSLIDSAIFISQDIITHIFKVKDKNAAWKTFRKKYNRNFYRMSLPIFTKDLQYCFIKIDYSCGSLCGTYLVNVYKREGNEWRMYKNVDYGVS